MHRSQSRKQATATATASSAVGVVAMVAPALELPLWIMLRSNLDDRTTIVMVIVPTSIPTVVFLPVRETMGVVPHALLNFSLT